MSRFAFFETSREIVQAAAPLYAELAAPDARALARPIRNNRARRPEIRMAGGG